MWVFAVGKITEFVSGWLKDRKEERENVLAQIDVIEDQYSLLMEDYADLKSQWRALLHRKIQIKKQIENLNEAIDQMKTK